MNLRIVPIVVAVLLSVVATPTVAGDYDTSPAAASVIEAAVARGVDRDWAESVLKAAQKQQMQLLSFLN